MIFISKETALTLSRDVYLNGVQEIEISGVVVDVSAGSLGFKCSQRDFKALNKEISGDLAITPVSPEAIIELTAKYPELVLAVSKNLKTMLYFDIHEISLARKQGWRVFEIADMAIQQLSTEIKYNTNCPICGSKAEDIGFAVYCSNPSCQNFLK